MVKKDGFMIGKGDGVLDFKAPKVGIFPKVLKEIFAMVFILPAKPPRSTTTTPPPPPKKK